MPNERAPEPRWRRYLRFWTSNIAADVDDEIRFHIEERIDDLVAGGMHPEAAQREALRRLGDIDHVKQTCRALASEQERSMIRSLWFDAMK